MSSLERVVYDILVQEKISFEREKIFTDCRQGKYRFDFYLPNLKIAIECNGAQHYEYSKFFYKKNSDFQKAQERDRRKISYCLANGIKLYCIPYWEINSISKFQDIQNPKFLARSKFHNDEVWRTQKDRD